MNAEELTAAIRAAGTLRLDSITANTSLLLMRRVLKEEDDAPVLEVAAFNSSI